MKSGNEQWLRKKLKTAVLLAAAGIWLSGIPVYNTLEVAAQDVSSGEKAEPGTLYAQSAVLMDADSGRILFEKNGDEERAMASTTKIMTCILALERGNPDDTVTASAEAASQPRVRLGVTAGETFLLKDLLYSLMLESHNDAAVMIAEHIGGSVEGFAELMNAKAKELGLEHTYYITPNGLDASDENGAHRTTASELGTVMKYCIAGSGKSQAFLEITQTPGYQFTDLEKKRTFSCTNHNAFLGMMEGALSGKTGFTGDAGYCYVGALQRDERTFIVALLGCGWPNHKNYKWEDTKTLMNFGIEHYQYRDISREIADGISLPKLTVAEGASASQPFARSAKAKLEAEESNETYSFLLADWETVEVSQELPEGLQAPVEAGTVVGRISCRLNEETLLEIPVKVESDVQEVSFSYFLDGIAAQYFLQNKINQ